LALLPFLNCSPDLGACPDCWVSAPPPSDGVIHEIKSFAENWVDCDGVALKKLKTGGTLLDIQTTSNFQRLMNLTQTRLIEEKALAVLE